MLNIKQLYSLALQVFKRSVLVKIPRGFTKHELFTLTHLNFSSPAMCESIRMQTQNSTMCFRKSNLSASERDAATFLVTLPFCSPKTWLSGRWHVRCFQAESKTYVSAVESQQYNLIIWSGRCLIRSAERANRGNWITLAIWCREPIKLSCCHQAYAEKLKITQHCHLTLEKVKIWWRQNFLITLRNIQVCAHKLKKSFHSFG